MKMFIASLQGATDAVHIDVLTFSDIEKTKAKKTLSNKAINPALLHKRYLILTHQTDFDQTRYPLTLEFIEAPSKERIKTTIRRLSQELKLHEIH